MNPTTNRSAKSDMVRRSGKPNPPKSKAIVGKLHVGHLMNIDPQRTTYKAYTKRVK